MGSLFGLDMNEESVCIGFHSRVVGTLAVASSTTNPPWKVRYIEGGRDTVGGEEVEKERNHI